MKNKNRPFIGILLIIGIFFFRDYYKKKDIENNETITVGKITEFRTHYQARYSIVYKYKIDGKEYEGHASVSPFKCDNGKKGCVGKEFKIFYSKKNPKNSRIDLGKYEKFR